jgi:hypothetical protein
MKFLLIVLVLSLLISSSSSLKLSLSSLKSNKIFKTIGASLVSLSILTSSSSNANAGLPFFTSAEQSMIDDIELYQKPVAELLDDLKPTNIPNAWGVWSTQQVLKGGKEDSDVVLTYLMTYIKPLQSKMEKAAPGLHLNDQEAQKRLEILPSLMKGHILELNQAIQEMKAASQAKEVEEVQETLAEFLKLASSQYEVKPYIPTRALTDAELFGPLGCEFWGKKRVPGSNACATDDEMANKPKAITPPSADDAKSNVVGINPFLRG